MTSEKKRIARLERALKRQERILVRLATALYTHTRTDLAPDAALPTMKKIVDELKKGARK